MAPKSTACGHPRPKGWGMLRAAHPHAQIYGSRIHRVSFAQSSIYLIGTLLSFPLRFLNIVLDCLQSHFLRIERTCRLTIGFDPIALRMKLEQPMWTASLWTTFEREDLGEIQERVNMIHYYFPCMFFKPCSSKYFYGSTRNPLSVSILVSKRLKVFNMAG
jgi:hypothetical protein